ncbi:MAG: OmpA family protein [Spirochaetaceae bacterium]|jgi:flagellar hook assembly protein FlgD|nr:OmpA family protein [Spirochaetaceae bacterium]
MKNKYIKKYTPALAALYIMLAAFPLAAQDEQYYISPNGDGVKDQISIPLSIYDSRFIKSWNFVVTNSGGREVYRQGESLPAVAVKLKNWKEILAAFIKPKASISVPSRIVWDGKTSSGGNVPDGVYLFYFSATDDNDNYSETRRYRVVVDVTPPKIEVRDVSATEKTFGQAGKPTLGIQQSGSREDLWIGEIRNSEGKVVRVFEWRDSVPQALVWDGSGEGGLSVPDGVYEYSISAEDAAGNKSAPASVSAITFDSTPKDAEAGRLAAEIAPLGKTKRQTFTLKASDAGRIESWTFAVFPLGVADAQPVAKWPARASDKMPAKIEWDGRLEDKTIAEGNFVGKLEIKYASGSLVEAETAPFASGKEPEAGVTAAPALFSPDGDGANDTLAITLNVKTALPIASWSYVIYDPNNKPFWTVTGKSEVTSVLNWNGRGDDGVLVESAMDYPYTFTVVDVQEQTTVVQGKITIDVLVLKDGQRLVIRVPAIIFRANNADFVPKTQDAKRGLTQEVIDNNEKVLKRIAEILQRFRDYRVTVEGHANSETGTEKEEVEQLVPLSQKRAEFVKGFLVQQGVGENRLTAVGVGGRRPVSKDRKDRENWWKNRRVEFVLEQR